MKGDPCEHKSHLSLAAHNRARTTDLGSMQPVLLLVVTNDHVLT